MPNIVDGEICDGVSDVDVQQDFNLTHHEYWKLKQFYHHLQQVR